MKRYIRSSKQCILARSSHYKMVDQKISDIFKEFAEQFKEQFTDSDSYEEFKHDQVADYIAQNMVDLLSEDEWKQLAFDWLQMNYK